MSTPKGTGSGGRLRPAGLALVALAVIAVVIGLVVAVTREEQQASTATQPPVTSADGPSPSAVPSVMPYPPPVPSFPEEAPVVPPPGSAFSPGFPPAPPAAVEEVPVDNDVGRGTVRVYNNSTIRGLAARAADDLTAAGWTVVEVGNYPQGIIPTTTVYYPEGGQEQAIAEAIGAEFGMRVEPRFPGIEDAAPGVIVIITNDYASP